MTTKPVAYALSSVAAVAILVVASLWWPRSASTTEVVVYKKASCTCCSKWIDHLRANGFTVSARNEPDLTALKAKHGVEPRFASCHTAVVGDYVVEGHVPAEDIWRLLRERPAVAGIAVPGMPLGSPGMEVGRSQPYDVLTFDQEGDTAVYSHH
jgi:hypothetical protein